MEIKMCKLVVTVPLSHSDIVRKAVGDTLKTGKFEKYSQCSFSNVGVGRFKPSDEAKPFIGELENLNEYPEERIEFDMMVEDIEEVVKVMLSVHPYEQVMYDVYPLLDF
jgi:hypothetical protein